MMESVIHSPASSHLVLADGRARRGEQYALARKKANQTPSFKAAKLVPKRSRSSHAGRSPKDGISSAVGTAGHPLPTPIDTSRPNAKPSV